MNGTTGFIWESQSYYSYAFLRVSNKVGRPLLPPLEDPLIGRYSKNSLRELEGIPGKQSFTFLPEGIKFRVITDM